VLLLVGAEIGIVLWATTVDCMAVKARERLSEHVDPATLQNRKLGCLALGIAIAGELGGVASQFTPDASVVFAMSAMLLWAAFFMMPWLPERDEVEEPVRDTTPWQAAKEIALECGPWLMLSNCIAAVPQTDVPVMYFLMQARGFSPLGLGTLLAVTASSVAVASAFAEWLGIVSEEAPFWSCLIASTVACTASYALVLLPDTSWEAEAVPSWVLAGAVPLLMSAQASMVVTCCASLARSLAERDERRASVTTIVNLLPGLGRFVGSPSSVYLCRAFRVAAGDLSGVQDVLKIAASIQPLTVLMVPLVHHGHTVR
jgi:hypothetical protein